MKIKLLIAVLLMCFIAGTAGAVEVVMDEDYKTESMKTEDDYIYFGDKLVFKGESEDLIFFGKNLDFTGKTSLGLFAFGKDILVDGKIGNGIASASRDISIKGNIKGTNFLAGKRIVIEEGTVINGSVFAAAAEVTVRGQINGNLYTGAGKVIIENTINGNINAHTGRLMILDPGKINGNLTYSSDKELSAEELAKITGSVNFEKNETSRSDRLGAWSGIFKMRLFIKFWFLAAFILSGFLLLFLPTTRVLENQRSGEKFWYTSLYGLIPLFMYPAIVVLSAILVVTLPLTAVLLLAIIPLSFITKVFGVTMLGQYVSGLFKMKKVNRFLFFLIGFILSAVISFIPFVGFLFSIFLNALGFGLIISYMFKLKTV